MRSPLTRALGAAAAALLLSSPSPASADAVPGQAAPDFSLKDAQGRPHALSKLKGQVVVLEWVNPECPFVKKHYGSQNMQKLQKAYGAKGVTWLLVNSSAPGKQGHLTTTSGPAFVKDSGAAAAALLFDHDGQVGRLYGAKTTPHMYVIDRAGKLAYAGAIDDKPSTDPDDIPGARNYVSDALDAVLQDKAVATASTAPYGCSVKY